MGTIFGPIFGPITTGGGGGVAPTISIVSPSVGSALGRTIPLVFTTYTPALFRRVVVTAQLGGDIVEELVHSGTAFGPNYQGVTNARTTPATGTYQFAILRDGGWRAASVTLRIIAIGTDGLIATRTIADPEALYRWPVI